jgi:DNA-binding PadR family transcriptional regulator
MPSDPDGKLLSNAAFLVLSLLAEGESHGYQLERQVRNRGFRHWADVKRSVIYQALKRMQRLGMVESRLEEGGGPARKVYSITEAGRSRLSREAYLHLSAPAHPRNEFDLGLYALPFLPRDQVVGALDQAITVLKERRAFLQERIDWCNQQDLRLVALNFERPKLTIDAEIVWLSRLKNAVRYRELDTERLEWSEYETAPEVT